LAPGLFVWNQFITVPQGASEVEIIGRQWQWSFRLPGEAGRLATSDTQCVSSDNPLGLNPNDPDAHDDVVIGAEDLHLPLDKPVKVLLRSIDVLHSFYVPEFRAKMDLVPGMVSYVWFTPTRAGTFELLCAELCGAAHYAMRAKVVVDGESEYQAWLRKQKTFAQLSARTRQAQETKKTWLLSHGAARREEETICTKRPKVVVPHRKERGHSNGRYHDWRSRSHPSRRSPRRRTLSCEELGDEIRLLPGRQSHRHPVFDHCALDWIGGSGAVVADTAAIGLPEHALRHRPRRIPAIHHHARHDHGDLSAH